MSAPGNRYTSPTPCFSNVEYSKYKGIFIIFPFSMLLLKKRQIKGQTWSSILIIQHINSVVGVYFQQTPVTDLWVILTGTPSGKFIPLKQNVNLNSIKKTRGPWATSLTWETGSNLVESVPIVLEKMIYKFRKFIFSLFSYCLPLENDGNLYLNKHASPPPKADMCQVWLQLAWWFWIRRFFKFRQCILTISLFFPL